MGMMDGGDNFKDICHKCDVQQDGGTMKRYVHNRNKKICFDCYEKLEDNSEYVYASQLKKGFFT
tara:strand:+ start:1679 stop:1870 length:192 start_codon:yes stop_codon:yes gene_type:complete